MFLGRKFDQQGAWMISWCDKRRGWAQYERYSEPSLKKYCLEIHLNYNGEYISVLLGQCFPVLPLMIPVLDCQIISLDRDIHFRPF
jgi:hypothetical protein